MKACGGQSTNLAKLYRNAAFIRYSSAAWARAPALSRIPRAIAQLRWIVTSPAPLSNERGSNSGPEDLIGPDGRTVNHVFYEQNDKRSMSRLTLLLPGVVLCAGSFSRGAGPAAGGSRQPESGLAEPGTADAGQSGRRRAASADPSGRAGQRHRHHRRGYPQVRLPHAGRSAGVGARILCNQ